MILDRLPAEIEIVETFTKRYPDLTAGGMFRYQLSCRLASGCQDTAYSKAF